MSSFSCNVCGKVCVDTSKGYITGCKHYPIETPDSPTKRTSFVKLHMKHKKLLTINKNDSFYKPTMQTTFDNRGNCLQAVIATLFDIGIDEIPCFADDDKWIYSLSQWMTKYFNKFVVSAVFDDQSDTKLFNESLMVTIINSPNPNVERHAVITKGNKIIFDPMVGIVDVEIENDMKPFYLLIADVRFSR